MMIEMIMATMKILFEPTLYTYLIIYVYSLNIYWFSNMLHEYSSVKHGYRMNYSKLYCVVINDIIAKIMFDVDKLLYPLRFVLLMNLTFDL